jgi:hypothetical protein
MFIVAPRGRTKDEIFSDTPIFSWVTLMVIGSVAELERVTKAVRVASLTPLKKRIGDTLAQIVSNPEYTNAAWMMHPR